MTEFTYWFQGEGHLLADWTVTGLITVATFASAWNVKIRGNTIRGWLLLVGFGMHSARLFYTLLTGGDPLISPIGLICLGMISIGWTMTACRSRATRSVDRVVADESFVDRIPG